MIAYRFVCFDEVFHLEQNKELVATKPTNRFGSVNTATKTENGIFFSIKRNPEKDNGVYHFMMDTAINHYLLKIEIPDDDKRIVEKCLGIYDDIENFDYDPNDPERPQVCIPEVIVKSYSKEDVVEIIDMNTVKNIKNHGCGYITF